MSLHQIRKYKEYAYKWDYIQCSQFSGLKPKDYDGIFESKTITDKNRKNSHRYADLQMDAIRSLNAKGIQSPTVKQINQEVVELRQSKDI